MQSISQSALKIYQEKCNTSARREAIIAELKEAEERVAELQKELQSVGATDAELIEFVEGLEKLLGDRIAEEAIVSMLQHRFGGGVPVKTRKKKAHRLNAAPVNGDPETSEEAKAQLEAEKKLLISVMTREPMSIGEILDAVKTATENDEWGVDDLRPALNDLLKAGSAKSDGERRGKRYFLAEGVAA